MSKVKIVLDADVIIHFSKGNFLSILPTIFPSYEYTVLDKVYHEIKGSIKSQLDNQIQILKNISIIQYKPTGIELKEFAILSREKGQGESACLAYCRFNHNVIGSSNLKDIADYCNEHQMTYLTTVDFLYYAVKKNIISLSDADAFIQEVIKKGSMLPNISMSSYNCHVII